MKTLTEFDGFRIKHVLNLKKELTTAGKTPEELPAALGEALKLEGDKLTTLLHALDVAENRLDNLKRVVVFAAEEGKKAPHGAVEKEGKHFLSEFFFSPQPRGAERDARGKGRGDGKRGGKGRGGGRDSGRGGSGGGGRSGGGRDADSRRAGPPVPHNPLKIVLAPLPPGASPAPGSPETGEKTRRPRRRRPRGPRREGAPDAQSAGPKDSAVPLGPPKPHKLPVPNKVPEPSGVAAQAPDAASATTENKS